MVSLLERIPPERIRRSKSNNLHTYILVIVTLNLYRSSDQSIHIIKTSVPSTSTS